MRTGLRGLITLVGALSALTLVPGTATAAIPTWYSNPSSCTNVTTVAEWKGDGRYLQLRRGKCGSAYYVWARADDNQVVELGVWQNSPWKLIATDKTQNGSGNTHYTRGRRSVAGQTYLGDAGSSPVIVYSP
jgi:hypothetical protein